jgi:hypothetical protein
MNDTPFADMDGETLAGEAGREAIREHAEALERLAEADGPDQAQSFADEHGAKLEEMTAEQAEQIAGPVMEIQIPMQQLVLHGANLRVVHGVGEQGDETALIIGPVGFSFALPLSEEAARILSRELAGGIQIAHTLPSGLKVVKS